MSSFGRVRWFERAEAHIIEEKIEEFSSRTAKEFACLVTAISSIEDESHKMKKRAKCIDDEIETLIHEKEAINVSLAENDERLKELLAKKNEMDRMTDVEIQKLKEHERTFTWTYPAPPPWLSSSMQLPRNAARGKPSRLRSISCQSA